MTVEHEATGDAAAGRKPRRILIFGVLRLQQMLDKGNPWQLSGYGTYFDEVHVAYLVGARPARLDRGRVRLVSLGTSSRLLDALIAPWQLYRYARHCGGFDVYQTPDVVFSWWTALLLRWLSRARIMLLPVAIPEQLYRDSGKSLSGLPIGIEKLMLAASFRAAHNVVTGHSFGSFVPWLRDDPRARHKLVVVDTVPDGLIGEAFVDRAEKAPPPRSPDGVFTLICVSRLHHEKLLEDLVKLMGVLRARGHTADRLHLRLIGGGPLEAELRAQISGLGLDDQITLAGAIPNDQVVDSLLAADAFVSPLTGSSLREAMFCRLPVIAYERDWVVGLFKNGEDALLVENRNVEAMADAVERLIADPELRQALGSAGRRIARRFWSIDGCEAACRRIHEASAVR